METDNPAIQALTWAEIDLDAIAFNAAGLKARAGGQAELMVTVKANAYGHGAVPVAQAAIGGGATRLAVHRVLEGVQLRQAGITVPILVMGYTLPAASERVVRWNLTPTVNSQPQAESLSAAAMDAGKPLSVHIKVDTGMGRYGLLPDEVLDFVRFLDGLPGLVLEGLYTHYAVADLADKTFTHYQFHIYSEVVQQLQAAGFDFPLKHVSNSATTLDLPEMALDMLRCGIALYGLRPSDEVEPAIPLRPALTLKSHVARVRTLPAGASISYGRTYITAKPTRVALVPVGYGDGYHRLIPNRGAVLIHGQRAPIVGRVCMDQFVVDVSHIPNVQLHDEVVLIGRQGAGHISAEEVARWAETINYEVTTSLLPRVVRVYVRGGGEGGERGDGGR
ncbi:MAG: alanine racemase [Anaerolineae bacterium]|nr:alanine racemase [Anaerolineae bacterium]